MFYVQASACLSFTAITFIYFLCVVSESVYGGEVVLSLMVVPGIELKHAWQQATLLAEPFCFLKTG